MVLHAEHLSSQPSVLVAESQQLTLQHQVAQPPLLSGPLGRLVVLGPLVPVAGVLLVGGDHLPLAARNRAARLAAVSPETNETSSQQRGPGHREEEAGVRLHVAARPLV